MLKIFVIFVIVLGAIALFVQFFLPRLIKKRRRLNEFSFADRDLDLESFFAYFMPEDYAQFNARMLKKDPRKRDVLTYRKEMLELENEFKKQYGDYFKEIDKRFLKNYFSEKK